MRDHRAQRRRVDLKELRPLGEQQDDVGVAGRLERRVARSQLREGAAAFSMATGSIDPYRARRPLQAAATSSAGESRMSSELGLNAAPSTATRLPTKVPPVSSRASSTAAVAAAQVDRVDLAQERQRLVDAELAGPGHERADVLGQAAAAEAEAGVEEPPADAGVVGQRLASCVTSAPEASHTSAIALMKEILVARKELAATLTSSAVARSVTTTGVPSSMSGA